MYVADCGSDLALLWLWLRLVATAQIRPLAWELSCAAGVAKKKKKKKKKEKEKKGHWSRLHETWHLGSDGFSDSFQPWGIWFKGKPLVSAEAKHVRA